MKWPWTIPSEWRALAWWFVPLGAVFAAYLPDLGRGFIKDDFAWILGSRTSGPLGWIDLFGRDNGFYRPLVSLSFALDERLFGLEPYWYGLTNLALVIGCMVGLYTLGRALGMPRGTALLAASLWALNPHGIGGAILWISGRTALLLVMFSLLAAVSTLRGWHWAAAVFCLAAMLSKEEAVVLPLILTVWAGTRSFRSAATLTLPVVLYFALRSGTAAYLPHTAPEYYQPTLAPAVLARNVLEYADRSGTLAAVVVILVLDRHQRTAGPTTTLDHGGCPTDERAVIHDETSIAEGSSIPARHGTRIGRPGAAPRLPTCRGGRAAAMGVARTEPARGAQGGRQAPVALPLLPTYRGGRAERECVARPGIPEAHQRQQAPMAFGGNVRSNDEMQQTSGGSGAHYVRATSLSAACC